MNLFSFFRKKKAITSNIPSGDEEKNILYELVNASRHIVDANPMGHLSLSNRISILSTVRDVNTVNKIFFECAKKVYPIWKEKNPDDTIVLPMLIAANDYLYKGENTNISFCTLADTYKDTLIATAQENPQVGNAGLTTLSLTYSIAFDAGMILEIDEYAGEDDDVFDWEGWSSGFYASMTYSNGNPFNGTGDIELRKEFWNWYLDTVLAIYENPNQPISSIVY